jgi:glyoxylase-like metal-dependent hydrolase (beta-lactamase superfamily II)
MSRSVLNLVLAALTGLACKATPGAPEKVKEPAMLEIQQLLTGRDFAKKDSSAAQMANFVYLVSERASGECLLVDAAWDIPGLLDIVAQKKLKLVAAVVTHGHWDHVRGLEELWQRTHVPIFVHTDDAQAVMNETGLAESALRRVQGGDTVALGATKLSFLHTPGHTPGSMTLRTDEAIITGDTLFVGNCGRVDLGGSDPKKMFESLQKLAALPEGTLLFPGHNYGATERSTIGAEKKTNVPVKAAAEGSYQHFVNAP